MKHEDISHLKGDEWCNARQAQIMNEVEEKKSKITRRIKAKEHASILRRELKIKFPDIKFSVRSSHFAGGSAVDVYTKGEGCYHPRSEEIRSFVKEFDGFETDLMDGRYNVGFEYNGERIVGASFCSYQGNI
jgi:hypothetical protein